jgi:hypothetical protein
MWDTILLSHKLAVSVVKGALSTGHMKLQTPQTASGNEELKKTVRFIRTSRSDAAAFTYCLLAEEIYLDGMFHGGWDMCESIGDDVESVRLTPLVQNVSDEFNSFIRFTNSGSVRNFLSVQHSFKDTSAAANMINELEPLIWRSFTRRSDNGVSRPELRSVLDILVLEPDLIRLHSVLGSTAFKRQFSLRCHTFGITEPGVVKRLEAICWVAITKGEVAANQMLEVERLDALFPVDHLSYGRNRSPDRRTSFGLCKSEELIAATRLFLKEIQYWPVLKDFEDVLRLKQHQDFRVFRDHLRQWTRAIVSGDIRGEAAARKEIEAANKSLSRAATCTKIGGLATYIGLPLTIVDMFIGPVFGTPLTVAGFGMQAYADWVKKANRWMIIGR